MREDGTDMRIRGPEGASNIDREPGLERTSVMEMILAEMKANEKGLVRGCLGGYRLSERLNALGLHKGKEITKVSDSFIGGPVTMRVNRSLMAVGYGMAARILVEVER
jgi:ferrous iron transport protein A